MPVGERQETGERNFNPFKIMKDLHKPNEPNYFDPYAKHLLQELSAPQCLQEWSKRMFLMMLNLSSMTGQCNWVSKVKENTVEDNLSSLSVRLIRLLGHGVQDRQFGGTLITKAAKFLEKSIPQ